MNTIRIYDATRKISILEYLRQSLQELFIYRFALANIVRSTLRARYRRSVFGFLWSLLTPLLTLSIMGIVFSNLYKVALSGFALYLFSGLVPWNLVANSLYVGGPSIILAEGYLKKVYVPKLMFPIAYVGVEVVNFIFSLASLFILAMFLGLKLSWALITLPFAIMLLSLFMLGLVLILCVAMVYFRDLSHITQIGITGMFYLTPVLYPPDFLSGFMSIVIKINPFFYFIELFHAILYRASFPDPALWGICALLVIISLILGLIVFASKDGDIIFRL